MDDGRGATRDPAERLIGNTESVGVVVNHSRMSAKWMLVSGIGRLVLASPRPPHRSVDWKQRAKVGVAEISWDG